MKTYTNYELSNYRLTFGKYRRWRLADVPVDYLPAVITRYAGLYPAVHNLLIEFCVRAADGRINVKMPFGKHKGKFVSQLGSRYLEWLLTSEPNKDDPKAFRLSGELLPTILEDEYRSRCVYRGDRYEVRGIDAGDEYEKGETRPFDPSACRKSRYRRPPAQAAAEDEDSTYRAGLPPVARLRELADARRVLYARVRTGTTWRLRKRRKDGCVLIDRVEAPVHETVPRPTTAPHAGRINAYDQFLRRVDAVEAAPDFDLLEARARSAGRWLDVIVKGDKLSGDQRRELQHLINTAAGQRKATLRKGEGVNYNAWEYRRVTSNRRDKGEA